MKALKIASLFSFIFLTFTFSQLFAQRTSLGDINRLTTGEKTFESVLESPRINPNKSPFLSMPYRPTPVQGYSVKSNRRGGSTGGGGMASTNELSSNGKKFDMRTFEQNIKNSLDGMTVGYTYSIAQHGQLVSAQGFGDARTSIDGKVKQSPFKRMNIASVSKTITATAVLKAMEMHPEVKLNSKIKDYLPSDWSLGDFVDETTFEQLLMHTSGFRNEGTSYGWAKTRIAEDLNPSDIGDYDYKNLNFALFRIIIPYIVEPEAMAEVEEVVFNNPDYNDQPDTWMSYYTAKVFLKFVNDHIFKPIGINYVHGTPTADATPTLFYRFDNGEEDLVEEGYHEGDWFQLVGSGGFHMSSYELGRFLAFLRYGNILSPTSKNLMDTKFLGWDEPGATSPNNDHGVYLNHPGYYFDGNNNGLDPEPNPDLPRGAYTVVINFPYGVQGVLMVNNLGGGYGTAFTVLRNAFDNAFINP